MMMDATTNFSGDIINGIEKQVTEEGFSAMGTPAIKMQKGKKL